MILIDSSVWIDVFGRRITPQVTAFDRLSGKRPLVIGDLMLAEVLQGCKSDSFFREVSTHLAAFEPLVISDHEVALQAAQHYRHLRSLGITVRKTIDALIAARCIRDRIPLLFSDRDFDPYVTHLGLRSAMDDLPGVN